MSVIKPTMIGIDEAGFDVSNSGAFAKEDGDYIERTNAATTNRQTWTYSAFVKRSSLGNYQSLFTLRTLSNNYGEFWFDSGNNLHYDDISTGVFNTQLTSSATYMDVAEYYHILLAYDSTDGTESERVRMYVNGTRISSFSVENYPLLNTLSVYNTASTNSAIGRESYGSTYYLDGYLSEVYFIDGQALTPDNFAEENSVTGQWNPKVYDGTYGTNGFYLNFQNGANLGEDSSGNGNDFTNSGVTQSTDTPTDNHWIINTLDPITDSTVNESGLYHLGSNSLGATSSSNILVTSGKWYWEAHIISQSGSTNKLGINLYNTLWNQLTYRANGEIKYNGIVSSYGATWTTGDIIGVAVDIDSRTIEFFKNNVSQGVVNYSAIFNKSANFRLNDGSGSNNLSARVHNTEQSWVYPAPSGFKALSSKNLPEPDIIRPKEYFDTYLYEGNGAGLQVGDNVQDIDLYPLSNSGAFASEEGDYLSWNHSLVGNRKTWTYSGWIKRVSIGGHHTLISSGDGIANNGYFGVRYTSDDTILIFSSPDNLSNDLQYITHKLNKDTSIWLHIVMTLDTTEVVNTDRFKLWVNGALQTFSTSIHPGLNSDLEINRNVPHTLGVDVRTPLGNFHNGYISEAIFVDGQALTADEFGQRDGNGFWVPKQYTSTYGSNGFHLDFTNNANLGEDSSGNNNDFTNNGVIQSIDNPTKNIAICDASDGSNTIDISESGTRVKGSIGTNFGISPSSLSPTRGKYYMEVLVNNLATNASIIGAGAYEPIIDSSNQNGIESGEVSLNLDSGTGFIGIFNNGIFISPLSAFNISDVIGIALDVDNSEVTFYKNNVVLGNGAYKILKVSPNYYFYIHARINNGTSDMTTRYDSSYWAYTAPLGFVELNSNNLENINGLGKPDLVWIKNRDQADSHTLFDSSRGIGKYLESDTTDSEATDVNSLQQFNKGGFYLGSSIATNTVNESYVAWVWKKGVTPGFDVVEYTGNGTSQNIDHNLGVIPEMYIVKNVNGTTTNWGVYHETIGADYYLVLDGSNAKINSLVAWNNTLPTATQFSVGGGHTSVSTDYIAYLFSEIEGYSKIGKYIGNGSTDGPFIHCGFRPAFLLIKSSIGAAGHWIIYDNVRDDNNDNIPSKLVPSTNGAESVTLTNYLDMLSNGFKIRSSSDTINLNAVTFIYMAFAESPFKYSRAR